MHALLTKNGGICWSAYPKPRHNPRESGECRLKCHPLCQFDDTARGISGVLGVIVRLMSDGELARLEVLRDLRQRQLGAETAAGRWGSSAAKCSGC